MGIFKRIGNVFRSNVNSAIDDLEDATKMTNQGILDLEEQLGTARKAMAAAMANSIRAKREYEAALAKPQEYETKAMALLKKVESGGISKEDGERLAMEALSKKEGFEKEVQHRRGIHQNLKSNADKFKEEVNKLSKEIENWKNKARTLKSRKELADSRIAMRQNLSSIDSSSTLNMLKRMEENVDKAEALAEAEDQLSVADKSTDDEINAALDAPTKSSDALEALRKKMGEG
jgi:phage shock protein A